MLYGDGKWIDCALRGTDLMVPKEFSFTVINHVTHKDFTMTNLRSLFIITLHSLQYLQTYVCLCNLDFIIVVMGITKLFVNCERTLSDNDSNYQ
jgi:hypothetical protein